MGVKADTMFTSVITNGFSFKINGQKFTLRAYKKVHFFWQGVARKYICMRKKQYMIEINKYIRCTHRRILVQSLKFRFQTSKLQKLVIQKQN